MGSVREGSEVIILRYARIALIVTFVPTLEVLFETRRNALMPSYAIYARIALIVTFVPTLEVLFETRRNALMPSYAMLVK
ncbi:unnamed protein product [Brugia pahangi]|uniref:Very-long-chain (3R)-3-hydroxyacyl-CoA dehydratase n=1 Tax=Brugia pahangi TaxID=6280 RepID=A0A0N4T6Y5_BRUPA|nr:unnamed protein product [Brugia pahangi]